MSVCYREFRNGVQVEAVYRVNFDKPDFIYENVVNATSVSDKINKCSQALSLAISQLHINCRKVFKPAAYQWCQFRDKLKGL